jgi:CheY-like chemotaxis protein
MDCQRRRVNLAELKHQAEPGKPLNVLLMEDDPDFAYWLIDMLQDAGHEVAWARSGTEALKAFDRRAFDLAIVDIYVYKFGRISADGGITLIGRIRNSAAGIMEDAPPRLPIIAISAAVAIPGNAFILNTAEAVGADASLAKPFTEAEILDVIAQVVPA